MQLSYFTHFRRSSHFQPVCQQTGKSGGLASCGSAKSLHDTILSNKQKLESHVQGSKFIDWPSQEYRIWL